MPIEVRQLREGDDRSRFRSGHSDLDRYFERYAGQNQFPLHIGTTYVAVDPDKGIVGFVTLAACSIEVANLPAKRARRLPKFPVPALRLARMAVASELQRSGVGTQLMKAVFVIAREQARLASCAFVVVDAKPGAESYYERWGFEPVPVQAGELEGRPLPRPMFLELGAIPDTDERLPGS